MKLRRGQLHAGEWLLAALALISLGLVASLVVRPGPSLRAPARDVRVIVDGVGWSLPTAAAPRFESSVGAKKIPSKYNARTGVLDYFQEQHDPAMHQDAFHLDRKGLEYFARSDAKRYGGLVRLDQLWVGGPPRLSSVPEREHEARGPQLFARPSIVSCLDVPDLVAGDTVASCKLHGWAPGGVPVQLLFRGRDASGAISSAEALLADLRLGEVTEEGR